MNIKDNSVQPKFKTMKFGHINFGEAFEYTGDLCIKVHPVDNGYNAVNLASGTFKRISCDTMVHQLHKGEITYEICVQEEE